MEARSEDMIDDEAATLAPAVLAGFLQEKIGQRAAADLLGLADSKQLGRYQKVDGPRPRPAVENRLREAYKIVVVIDSTFDADVARSWLAGTNSRLAYRTPTELLRSADSPEEFKRLRMAAQEFVASEATVRDPLGDMDAVNAARARPMAERLELALSWNLMASELRAGMAGGEVRSHE